MHELSIANSIITIARVHADGRRVEKVYIKLGRLRHILPSALQLGFELLTHETPLQGVRLEIEDVPAIGRCRRCGAETELYALPSFCAVCGHDGVDLLCGEELYVDAIEVEESEVQFMAEEETRQDSS